MSLADVFTPKQQEVIHSYLNKDFKYLILAGAVRSGKTYIDNFLFLMDLKRAKQRAIAKGDKHPQYILAGYSSGTIYNNVISSLEKQFGFDMKTDRHGHYNLSGLVSAMICEWSSEHRLTISWNTSSTAKLASLT